MGVGVDAPGRDPASSDSINDYPHHHLAHVESKMNSALSVTGGSQAVVESGETLANGAENHVSRVKVETAGDTDSENIDVESTPDPREEAQVGKTAASSLLAAEPKKEPATATAVNGENKPTVSESFSGWKMESQPDWSPWLLPDIPMLQWLQLVRRHTLMPLLRHPKSAAFRKPVDPVALGIYPIYNQVITRPMDLGTVRERVDKKRYERKEDCLTDLNQVWINAKCFNPTTHVVYEYAVFLQKQMFAGLQQVLLNAAGRSVKSTPPPPVRHVGMREARKKPPLMGSLPGEYEDLKPQHLEQKYKQKLSDSLKACDVILRNLMMQSQHRDYVDPFLKAASGGMSLSLINERLRNHYYSTALDFADDFRRIISETYRAAENPEEDFRSLKARKLQAEFETQFARVNTDNDYVRNDGETAHNEDTGFIAKLVAAQNLISDIQTSVGHLVHDLKYFRRWKEARRRRDEMAPPPSKRRKVAPKTTPSLNKPAHNGQPDQPRRASPEQISVWIGRLDAKSQGLMLNILEKNGETIDVDDDGSVELSLANWSSKTMSDVEQFLRDKLPPSAIREATIPAAGGSGAANKDAAAAASSDEDSSAEDSSSSSEEDSSEASEEDDSSGSGHDDEHN